MRTREEQREERRKYEADVCYEVWRSGGSPDCVNLDRIEDSYYQDRDYESAARQELSAQKPRASESEPD